LNVYRGIRQKNHGLSRSTDLDLHLYKGKKKKNDGLEPKYRFGFAYIYGGNTQKNHGVG